MSHQQSQFDRKQKTYLCKEFGLDSEASNENLTAIAGTVEQRGSEFSFA